MKRKNIIIFVILVFIILITFFVLKNSELFNDGNNQNEIENAIYYTDKRAQELFIEDGNYSFINLKEHEVYKVDDTLHIDFYFDNEVTKNQLDNARLFALSTFVLRYSSPSEESPYMIFNSADSAVQWVTVTCRIYVDDKLNSEDKYDENGQVLMDSND